MKIPFTKMQGLGNDFVLLDGMARALILDHQQIRHIADRRFGIGCDQVLLIEAPTAGGADVRYRIFNADGNEVEQCGNGARCVALYLRDRGLAGQGTITAQTTTGTITLYCQDDGHVRVGMGVPVLAPSEIPMLAERQALRYEVALNGERLSIGALSMGNPHAVIQVDEVEAAPVERLGSRLSVHPMFPEGVNVGFAQIVDRGHIRLRVYERGVGETLACGSGACAAVAMGRLRSLLEPQVEVELPGGRLEIEWQGEGNPLWMTGPAAYVFEGSIML